MIPALLWPDVIPKDSGPIYVETRLAENPWLVEPLNTLSNLGFGIVILYWILRTRKTNAELQIVRWTLPLLLVGWIGGTLYHGWRSAEIYYVMDYAPIYLLTLIFSLHLWARSGRLWVGGLVDAVIVAIIVIQLMYFPQNTAVISFLYLSLSVAILLPAALCGMLKNPWLLACFAVFAMAIAFRHFDAQFESVFYRGSHFLWHIGGAISVHCFLRSLETSVGTQNSGRLAPL